MTEQLSTNDTAAQKYVPPTMEERRTNNIEKPQLDYNNTHAESFDDLELKESLLRGVYAMGYEKPSIIQQTAILPVLHGHDVIAQAQSGTGKTATFSIGILNRIDETVNQTQGLVLAHTRELALQIHTVMNGLGQYMNLTYNLCVGGTQIKENIDQLLQNPQIVIGTPGRVLDMINKKALHTRTLRMLVIDEADEMLSKIFSNQIYDIFRFLPNDIQVGLFSATMTPEFFKLTKCFMRDPVKILVKNEELTLEGIRQFYINLDKSEYKFGTLCDIYSACSISQTIIYCNSRRTVDQLTRQLVESDFSVECIHGEMTQEDRNKIMQEFRNGSCRVLISTDLLSRGIDVQQVSLVINYDLPNNVESYIHRIGRSGRFGRKGTAINFLTGYDAKKMEEIEQYYSTTVQELPANFSELV
jgi:translation initiation factor 4A